MWRSAIISICLAMVCSTTGAVVPSRQRAVGGPRPLNTAADPFFPASGGFLFDPAAQYHMQAYGAAPESLRTVNGVTTVVVWRVRNQQWCMAQTFTLGGSPVVLDSSKFAVGDFVMFEDWPFTLLVTLPDVSIVCTRVHGADTPLYQTPQVHGVPCD